MILQIEDTMKKVFSFFLILIYIFATPPSLHAYSGGPPNGYAGNPPNNRTCISCHSTFGLNSGQGSLDLSDLPEVYEPEQEYEFSITLADPNAARWGFEMTALNSENDRAGTFTVIDRNNTQLSRPGGDSPSYMKHTSAGTNRGNRESNTWDVMWTAPAEDIGDIRFFFAGNAANNNGGRTGDRIYSSSFTMEPAEVGRELTVEMTEGWNMISINVRVGEEYYADEDADGPDVILMTDQLRIDEDTHNLLLMKDSEGRFYSPDFNFSSIPFWSETSGYQIKLREDANGVWSGEPIPANLEISMHDGWNMIAYFPTYQLSADDEDYYVLSSIIDQVITAKDGDGNFMRPDFNFSNMAPWRETQGYQVKLDGDVDFTYPEERDERAQFAGKQADQPMSNLPIRTGENMSVLVYNLPTNISSADLQVVAYSDLGLLVGRGDIIDGRAGLAIWGDDPTTDAIDGLLDDEGFELFYLSDGVEFSIDPVEFRQGSDLIYEKDGFLALEVDDPEAMVFDYALSEPYPNPFNSTTKIGYRLFQSGQVSINVYNLQGEIVKTLYDGFNEAGYHTIVLKSDELSSGLYFVMLKSSAAMFTQKVVLIK